MRKVRNKVKVLTKVLTKPHLGAKKGLTKIGQPLEIIGAEEGTRTPTGITPH